MSGFIRGGVLWFVGTAAVLSPVARGQSVSGGLPSAHQPFAKPGTPRQTERIRFFDVKHIKAELKVDTKNHKIGGVVTHTIAPLHPLLQHVELDCGPEIVVSKVTIGARGVPCSFEKKPGKLVVQLDKKYGANETIDIAISYSGSPSRGLYFVDAVSNDPKKTLSFWTQGEAEDTRFWLPCYDYPNERATSEMIITVPRPLFVLSNGVLKEIDDGALESTTYHWVMDAPHASYLISLAGADFAIYHDRAGDLPLDYYVAKHVGQATARRLMGNTPKMMHFFGEKTGQPYPYNKYAQVCVPDFVAGGMENITATTLTDTALADEIAALETDGDSLVAHELAHQWFGDYLTCRDWSHIWLNEGFATYFAALFAEDTHGDDAFRLDMRRTAGGYFLEDLRVRRPLVEARYQSGDEMFDGVTYSKGACVLHMLRGVVGDDAWWKGIRGYVRAHKLSVVDSENLRAAMEAAWGKDLKWFFEQWAYKAGHPELKVRWRYEESDKTVRLQVQQTQRLDEQTPLFRIPTEVEITEGEAGPRNIPIVIDGRSHEFVIASATRPKLVEIDPRGWLLAEIDFPKSDQEHLFGLEHAACFLGRLKAAEALVRKAGRNTRIAAALALSWKREKAASTRHEMFAVLCNGQETFRAALSLGATDHEPRVRVAAIGGLSRLRRNDQSEAILRAAWNDPKQPYGSRKAALRGLYGWKVKDSALLLAQALTTTAGDHTIAAAALDLSLAEPGAKARELALRYSDIGQPQPLRLMAIGAFGLLAKDDPALHDALVKLSDDPDRWVRLQAWTVVRQLKLKKALPVLEARLRGDHHGFGGDVREVLESTIKELINQAGTPQGGTAAPSQPSKMAELAKEVADLQRKADELSRQIANFKPSADQGGATAPRATGGASSSGSH